MGASRGKLSPCVSRRRRFTRATISIASFVAIVSIATKGAFATEPASANRYRIDGAGTIALDVPVQRNGSLRLQAALSPSAPTSGAPALQSTGRFALTATLAAQSLVCYNDTIYRDDFDGDGF